LSNEEKTNDYENFEKGMIYMKNGLPSMKNPDALRIFFPECFGGKYKPLKKHNSRRIIS
jgi:hypothetical protein